MKQEHRACVVEMCIVERDFVKLRKQRGGGEDGCAFRAERIGGEKEAAEVWMVEGVEMGESLGGELIL